MREVSDITLILAFLSDEYVALASDRRITWIIGGARNRTEDTENKAVVLCGHFLMGYTGFARLGGVKTERWIVDTLAHVANPSDYFRVLAAEATQAVAAMKQRRERSGHAFVAVGFAAERGAPPDQKAAIGVEISNATGGGYGRWNPRPTFDITRSPPLAGPDDFKLNAQGIVPPRKRLEEAIDVIRRYRKRDRSRIVGVAQVLVGLIRSVTDDRVGKDISVSVLPRNAVPASEVSLPFGGLKDPVDELTCIFIPEDRDANSAIAYSPATVCPGMAAFGGEVWDRQPPWWKN